MVIDGKRYVASLQDVTDLQCYKDFYESEKQEDAKQRAEEAAVKHQRNALVFDRKVLEIIFKKVVERPGAVKVEPVKPQPLRRGKKKEIAPTVKEEPVKQESKKINKDAFFED